METNVNFSFEAEFYDFMSAKFHFMYFMFQVRKMHLCNWKRSSTPRRAVFFFFFFHNGVKLCHFRYGASETSPSDKPSQCPLS